MRPLRRISTRPGWIRGYTPEVRHGHVGLLTGVVLCLGPLGCSSLQERAAAVSLREIGGADLGRPHQPRMLRVSYGEDGSLRHVRLECHGPHPNGPVEAWLLTSSGLVPPTDHWGTVFTAPQPRPDGEWWAGFVFDTEVPSSQVDLVSYLWGDDDGDVRMAR